jgi:prepilin peptidase CpaA
MDILSITFLSFILMASSVIDLRSQRIPNFLTLPGILISLIYSTMLNGIDGFVFSILGVAAGIGCLIIPWLMGAMGAGDVKLMGAVGGFLGAKGALSAFLIIALVGGAYALVLRLVYKDKMKGLCSKIYHGVLAFVLTRKYEPDPADFVADAPKLCYGLAIALGTFLYIGLNASGYSFI